MRIAKDVAENWSRRLGLAPALLLGRERDPRELHFALFDGVEGSFALSQEVLNREDVLDWTWSSQLSLHVELQDHWVIARQISSDTPALRIEAEQVEQSPEKFFEVIAPRRSEPPVTIAEHLVTCFRAHRNAGAALGLDDSAILAGFLAVIENQITGAEITYRQLPEEHRERLIDELTYNRLTGRKADLALTMRHAAGMVFQETHAELVSTPLQSELFGLPPASVQTTRNRLGAYYTPPGLARILADLAIGSHLHKEELRILDPACGSGIFLCEIMRALQRRAYKGKVDLIGFDISSSAVEMARFALRHLDVAATATSRLETKDFLSHNQDLEADIVLMNPPFLSMPDMDAELRKGLETALGDTFRYRPDLSMAFTLMALQQLKINGTLATLLPSGALSQQGGGSWRERIIETTDVELIAVLGDHGMFRDAMVNVAALVVRKSDRASQTAPIVLWASQKKGASSAALMRLRRWQEGDHNHENTVDWSIYQLPRNALAGKDDWTPRPFSLGDLPERLAATPNVKSVGELFHVELGVRAGKFKDALQLDAADFMQLPAGERKFFRPVAETRSIRNGRISPISWIFYPDQPLTAGEIAERTPKLYQRYVEPLGFEPDMLIDLARARRKTNLKQLPKIVSRAFLSTDSFAVDPEGAHVVVQGYSWLPMQALKGAPFNLLDLLHDYCFVLNSRLFFALLRENGRIVGGGQVDGSKSQVKKVPLPDLAALYLETPKLCHLAEELRAVEIEQQPLPQQLDTFAAAVYRTSLDEWA